MEVKYITKRTHPGRVDDVAMRCVVCGASTRVSGWISLEEIYAKFTPDYPHNPWLYELNNKHYYICWNRSKDCNTKFKINPLGYICK